MPVHDDLLVLSVPVFVVSVVAEAAILTLWLRRPYPLIDAIGSMGTGIIQQLLFALASVVTSWTLYEWAYARFAIWHVDAHAPWAWVLAFVTVDFLYYWWHHASHKINWIWTGHLLHHQSEEFNLSTALRQSWLASLSGNLFYLPMAFLGFAPQMFLRVLILMTLYQFWIHTELIPRMPRFEWLFNSPSLHRVHHAINPKYLDRNFAGVFTIWDRIFGTYEPETEKPSYGVLKPLGSWNALWANFEPWVYLAGLARRAPGMGQALRVLIADPAWQPGKGKATPQELQGLFEHVRARKLEVRVGRATAAYVFVQFVLLLAVSAFYLNHTDKLAVGWASVFVAWICLSLGALGALSDGRAWARAAEAGRWLGGAAALGLYWLG